MSLDPRKFKKPIRSRQSAGTEVTSTSPFQFIHHSDLVYTLDGKAHPPEAVGLREESGVKGSDVLIVVPMRTAKNHYNPMVLDQEKFKQSKHFMHRYVIPHLHEALVSDQESQMPETFSEDYSKGYLELYHKITEEADPVRILTILKHEVENTLKGITPSVVNEDKYDVWHASHELLNRGLPKDLALGASVIDESREVNAPKKTGNERAINSALEKTPEWLQVLTHEHGAYVLTTNVPEIRKLAMGAALGTMIDKMTTIYLKSNFSAREERLRIRTLREELVHELQRRTDEEEANKAMDSVSGGIVRGTRWQMAAEPLIQRIDRCPEDDPALALIKKTEPNGGSLMLRAYKNDMEFRSTELLVDIYDAEIHLRTNKAQGGEGKSKEEAEKILKATFGDEVYNVSHEYITSWMDYAEKILAKKVGDVKASDYRKKWEESPLNHPIELTQLPEYKLSGPDVPAH